MAEAAQPSGAHKSGLDHTTSTHCDHRSTGGKMQHESGTVATQTRKQKPCRGRGTEHQGKQELRCRQDEPPTIAHQAHALQPRRPAERDVTYALPTILKFWILLNGRRNYKDSPVSQRQWTMIPTSPICQTHPPTTAHTSSACKSTLAQHPCPQAGPPAE